MGNQAGWRKIYKTISTSTRLSQVHPFSALLWTWMIPHADDWGRLQGDAEDVKYIVVPRIKKLKTNRVNECLAELEKVGLITVYRNKEFGDKLFIQLYRGRDHQTPGSGKKRKAPEFPEITEKMYFSVKRCKWVSQKERKERKKDRKSECGTDGHEPSALAPGQVRSLVQDLTRKIGNNGK